MVPTSILTDPSKPAITLSEAENHGLLTQWRDILEGRTQANLLPIPDEVETIIREQEAKFPEPITPATRRRLLRDQAILHAYPDQVVVCMETPSGCAVLAVGEAELALFLRGVPQTLQKHVWIEYPPPNRDVI